MLWFVSNTALLQVDRRRRRLRRRRRPRRRRHYRHCRSRHCRPRCRLRYSK